jgi:hypothetical protein
MDDPAFLLVLGFLLTSVLGGALAYYFQDRTWKHQRRAQQRDQRREHAGDDSTALREALDEYRQVVAEWNDNLNRTLALVHTYFGGGHGSGSRTTSTRSTAQPVGNSTSSSGMCRYPATPTSACRLSAGA